MLTNNFAQIGTSWWCADEWFGDIYNTIKIHQYLKNSADNYFFILTGFFNIIYWNIYWHVNYRMCTFQLINRYKCIISSTIPYFLLQNIYWIQLFNFHFCNWNIYGQIQCNNIMIQGFITKIMNVSWIQKFQISKNL